MTIHSSIHPHPARRAVFFMELAWEWKSAERLIQADP